LANIASAKKRIKVSARNRARRQTVVGAVKRAFKVAEKAILSKAADAAEFVKRACKLIDKAASNKVFHKNTAARHKSRLVKKLNKAKK
jgi:small subunit ribosomal protein S20